MFLYLKKDKHVVFYLNNFLSKREMFAKIRPCQGGVL